MAYTFAIIHMHAQAYANYRTNGLLSAGYYYALINYESHYATRSPATFDPTSGSKGIFELRKFPLNFFGASNCRGRADTLKLQSKLSNSAAEQTGLRDYMASKVDCKGVGIVGN